MYCTQLTDPSVIHPDHGKYNHSERFHEAGYDSLLTAQIFLKLASQLPKAQQSDSSNTSYTGSEWSQHTATSSDGIDNRNVSNLGGIPPTPAAQAETSLQALSLSEAKAARDSRVQSRFAHGNLFDTLAADDTIDQIDDSNVTGPSNTVMNEVKVQEMVAEGKLIPRFDSPIWDIYGNKLRVFGTAERVFALGHESPEQAL